MENTNEFIVGENMICPISKKHCDDECCPVGSQCNLSGDIGETMENTIEQDDYILITSSSKNVQKVLLKDYVASQISHHLDKLTEEIKEGAEIKNYYNFNSHVDKESITKITAEYKLKNKL